MSESDIIKYLKKGIDIQVPFFTQYVFPAGYLTADKESHACFMYFLNASKTYQDHVYKQSLVFEGEADNNCDFEQLFKSTARLYGIEPNAMAKAWPQVEKQAELLGMYPLAEKYKFIPNIIILKH